MPPQLHRVTDTVPQINNELAVGEDIGFQRKWWAFEHFVWVLFTLIIIADFVGVFGRGPLSKAHMHSSDGSVDVTYERVERYQTPSLLSIKFGKNAIQGGKIELWVSEGVVNRLGAQRVIPQPQSSALVDHGMLYTFPATGNQATVQFQLQPTHVGSDQIGLHGSTSELLTAKVFVMP